MAELKTKKNDLSVEAFLNDVADQKMRQDCHVISKMMQEATSAPPKMWGPSIIGFGDYHYKYKSGREGDWFLIGFSPRKQNITLYLMGGLAGQEELIEKLGKHKIGGSCLYVKKLGDIDLTVLKEIIAESLKKMSARAEK